MYVRTLTSSAFSTSSHLNGMWFGSLHFLKQIQTFKETDHVIKVKELYYIPTNNGMRAGGKSYNK
jgi:hypothetical protein